MTAILQEKSSEMKTLLLTVTFVAMVLTVQSMDPFKWRPANFHSKNEFEQAVVKTLNETVLDSGLDLETVDSFDSRPLMIGREYRTLYKAVSLMVSLICFNPLSTN